jgi:hypothetical protein
MVPEKKLQIIGGNVIQTIDALPFVRVSLFFQEI